MTTTDSSFIADGFPTGIGPRATIGFYANVQPRRPSFGGTSGPFKFGALAVGHSAGVYGATDDVVTIPPSANMSAGVWGVSTSSYGVLGQGNTAGVIGATNDVVTISPGVNVSAGVCGMSKWSYGVLGQSLGGSPAIRGEGSSGPGVEAYSSSNSGVSGGAGSWPSTLPPAGFDWKAGVSGQSEDHPAVVGFSTNQYGFQGFSINWTGVLGVSGGAGPAPQLAHLAGVIGSTASSIADPNPRAGVIGTSNFIGVYGFCAGANGAAISGHATDPTGFAGVFRGKVLITGDLTLQDTTVAAKIKSAIVPFPDGTKRVLHCMESPEHWFEDFGAGKLKDGRAVVRLDRDFAKVIRAAGYHVFLTPKGECRGLSVRRQGAKSFEVRELMGGKSAIAFSYRIVGRRKDIKGHRRFAKIDTGLRLPVPRVRPARRARRPKIARPTPAELRAFAAQMKKLAGAQTQKRRRKRRRSAR